MIYTDTSGRTIWVEFDGFEFVALVSDPIAAYTVRYALASQLTRDYPPLHSITFLELLQLREVAV